MTSLAHSVHTETPLPLAVGLRSCDWCQLGCSVLDSVGRSYSILFNRSSSTVVASAVLAGLAVSLLPESALRPGMRILTASDGFPELPSAEIGIIRKPGVQSALMDAITDHIAASLDNMTPVGPGLQQSGCMKNCTVNLERWKTGSRSVSLICLQIVPVRKPWRPISYDYGLPGWHMFCCVLCGVSALQAHHLPGPPVARSA